MATFPDLKLYNVENGEGGVYFSLKNPKMSKATRMKIALDDFPEAMRVTRPVSADEMKQAGYILMDPKTIYHMKSKAGRKDITLKFGRYLDWDMVYKAGLFPKLERIQLIAGSREFFDFCDDAEAQGSESVRAEYRKRCGTSYTTTITLQPGNQGIQLGKPVRKGSDELRELNKLLAEVYVKVLTAADMLPDNKTRWVVDACITVGYEKNMGMTTAQLNYSKPGENLGIALKKKGDPRGHIDRGDHPTCPTVLLFLSNLPEDQHEGRMNVLSMKLSCLAHKYGALVFCGRHPHNSSGVGSYPADYPESQKPHNTTDLPIPKMPDNYPNFRLQIPCYSNLKLMRPDPELIIDEVWSDQALVAFGTRRNFQEWKLRMYVKQNRKTLVESSETIQMLLKKYEWEDEDGEIQQPEEWIAEISLHWSEKDMKDYLDLHAAALFADCGDRVPDEEGVVNEAKERKRKRKEKAYGEDGQALVKKQCDKIKKDKKQCKMSGWEGQDAELVSESSLSKKHKGSKESAAPETNGELDGKERFIPEKAESCDGIEKSSKSSEGDNDVRTTAEEIARLQSELERQYEFGMKTKHVGGSKGRGLGA